MKFVRKLISTFGNFTMELSSSARVTRHNVLAEEKKKYASMSLEDKRRLYSCGAGYLTLSEIPTYPLHYKLKNLKPPKADYPKYAVDPTMNNKLSIFTGDITKLEIDAIVNAANEGLMAGGGVCGAIHRGAGSSLARECTAIGHCPTGSAVMTLGYKLPAKHVIHAVGPVGEKPDLLAGCYRKSLDLIVENQLTSIAFPCISTGIFGYPNSKAAQVVVETVRGWLEEDQNCKQIERIIFCLFLEEDMRLYNKILPHYFPVNE